MLFMCAETFAAMDSGRDTSQGANRRQKKTALVGRFFGADTASNRVCVLTGSIDVRQAYYCAQLRAIIND